MKPSRGLLLVKPVETFETRAGGVIILTADTRERITAGQCEVVAVGAPAECDPTRSRAERKCERRHEIVHDMDGKQGGCMEPHGYIPGRCVRFHPHDFRAGDWLLVRPRAFVDGPEPEKKEWFVHQDDVIAILERGNSNA